VAYNYNLGSTSTSLNAPLPAWSDTYGAAAPTSPDPNLATAGARNAFQANMLTNLGIGLGAQAVQTGIAAIRTAQDKDNNEAIRKFREAQARGRLVNTSQLQAANDAAQEGRDMVAAQASQNAMAADSRIASAGGAQSAADLNRPIREQQQALQRGTIAIGRGLARDKIAEAQRQIDEYQGRLAYKSEKAKGRQQAVVGAIGQVGQLAGQYSAAQRVQQMNTADLKDYWLLQAARKDDGSGALDELIAALNG
jgi:hypothetical protein